MRPICINLGCGKPVAVMEGSIHDDNPRWRVHCGHCQAASYGKWPHRAGVTPYKTGRCSNVEGILGFPCVINWSLAESTGLKLSTEVDHKNGNPADNQPSNLQELCSICHREKGKRQGDYDGWRHYRG
jgi:HNH endonuclease